MACILDAYDTAGVVRPKRFNAEGQIYVNTFVTTMRDSKLVVSKSALSGWRTRRFGSGSGGAAGTSTDCTAGTSTDCTDIRSLLGKRPASEPTAATSEPAAATSEHVLGSPRLAERSQRQCYSNEESGEESDEQGATPQKPVLL